MAAQLSLSGDTDLEKVIRTYLRDHADDYMADVLDGIGELLQWRVGDRHYRLLSLVSRSHGDETSWSALIGFHDMKCNVSVVIPWSGCPQGRFEVELTH